MLYHEIGHHKAAHTPTVSRHKDEAYAEKFMLACKKAWMKKHGPSWFSRKVVKYLIKVVAFPFVVIICCVKPKDPMTKLVLRRFIGRMSREEYLSQFNAIFHSKDQNKKKSKWTHPLEKLKYRKKFRIET